MWEGKLQSNHTHYSDTLQCRCPVHCYAKRLLSLALVAMPNVYFFSPLLRCVTRNQKGVGIFRNQEGKVGEWDKDEEITVLLYFLYTFEFFRFASFSPSPAFLFGLSVWACFSPLVHWEVYILFLLY